MDTALKLPERALRKNANLFSKIAAQMKISKNVSICVVIVSSKEMKKSCT